MRDSRRGQGLAGVPGAARAPAADRPRAGRGTSAGRSRPTAPPARNTTEDCRTASGRAAVLRSPLCSPCPDGCAGVAHTPHSGAGLGGNWLVPYERTAHQCAQSRVMNTCKSGTSMPKAIAGFALTASSRPSRAAGRSGRASRCRRGTWWNPTGPVGPPCRGHRAWPRSRRATRRRVLTGVKASFRRGPSESCVS